MEVKQKLTLLRKEMKNNNISAYIIPSADNHQSEYFEDYWKSREWMSGFNGSAGTLVVTSGKAGLWTDGRYFIQAEKQLKGSGIKLFKMGITGFPSYQKWLLDELNVGETIGFDGKVYSVGNFEYLKNILSEKKIKFTVNFDLVDRIRTDRPKLSKKKLRIQDVKFAGKTRLKKIEEIREKMKSKNANIYFLSSLDDIAWVLNVRGDDIPSFPVVDSFLIIEDTKVSFYLDLDKLDENSRKILEDDGIILKNQSEIDSDLNKLNGTLVYDARKTGVYYLNRFNQKVKKIEIVDFTQIMKAIKNEIEIENLKKTCLKDSVAVTKFLFWVDKNYDKMNLTELSVSDKLLDFRKKIADFQGVSFTTIAAYGENAAMMHYAPSQEKNAEIKAGNFLLIDSGGQYPGGTTDVTRTIAIGNIDDEKKRHFTLVVKGYIGVNRAIFLNGTRGCNLDILAREPIWQEQIDYKCGTGHGVGFNLMVHEGPQRLNQALVDVPFQPGMIITDEPGIYLEGKHGIRIENDLLVRNYGETESGKFLHSEVLNFIPIDIEAINPELLTFEEKDFLNNYHRKVWEKISPFLDEEEKEWLKNKTKKV